MNPTLDTIKAAYEKLGYPWHPILNIGGIRASISNTNAFDDLIFYCLRLPTGEWEFKAYEATTDPGFAKHGNSVPEGTASMKAGFYPKLYSFGFHQGKKDHPCFKQTGKAEFYRKKGPKLFDSTTLFIGIIGANIHSTREGFIPEDVDNFSKGCQVVRRWTSMGKLLAAGEASLLKFFDYALLQEKELEV